jgi:DNA-binding transcriptional regulator YiaG
MTPDEFRRGRERLGLTTRELAALFDVNDRTLRSWEYGTVKGRPSPVPQPIAMLMRLILRHQAVRMDLGLTLEDEPVMLRRR